MVSQSQTMSLRQSQNLVMSPQMQQSLKILQLSTLDLNSLIESELQNNPLLEKTDEIVDFDSFEDSDDNFTSSSNSDSDSYTEANSTNLNDDRNVLDADMNESWSSNESEHLSNNYRNSLSNNSEQDDAGTIIERTYTKELTLKEHLLEQVNLDFEDAAEKIIAAHLIDMVDRSGYLQKERIEQEQEKLQELLNCSEKKIFEVAEKLKHLDPTGVCSSSLSECLQIQLKELNRMDPAIGVLIDNLNLLAKGELKKLQKLCSVDEDDLKDMILEIKSLNPRPASNFADEEAQTKYPDLILVKKNNIWMVDLNMEMMPKVNVKRDFYYKMKSASKRKEDKKFLSENLASANFLVQAIARRTETLLRVAIEIVKQQQDFFEKGINYMKPISMKDIAEICELHESTIGRVVSNKFISTPRGVFELKYFFSNSLSGTYGDEEFSTETAKHQIKELIEQEDKILSDDNIAKILKDRGINIARRTVAKYREAMSIPTSAERKRIRKINI